MAQGGAAAARHPASRGGRAASGLLSGTLITRVSFKSHLTLQIRFLRNETN